ncbi:MAG: hypothetical protein Q4A74_09605, partial [Cardiobacteriaceae bacterium]|nr:hypothetical protein [Cardiobacteriaceae bacterium]
EVMDKPALILLNIFLLLFWILVAFPSPSYLNRIQEKPINLRDVELSLFKGRGIRFGIAYEQNGKRYFSSCRNMKNDQGYSFCDYRFPIKASKLHANLILEGNYHNSQSYLIINSVEWEEEGQKKKFLINKDEYMSVFRYLRNTHYLVRLCIPVSFLILNLYFIFKNRRSQRLN